MTDDRRLIEDYLPIQAISAEASREKSVRKGHISTLHLWWARRPLVACRAAVYGALVPLSRFRPKNGPEGKRDSLARANAAKFVERLCKYPGTPHIIAEAEQHILEAHAARLTGETGQPVTVEDIREGRAPRPKVLDMFAGGGSIPLEALRLGCEAYALDLNPVAHIIELCTLVYPQKYGKADPAAPGMTGPKNNRGETTWGGLADEVRYWGNWVLEKVRAEIGDLYPFVPDPEHQPGVSTTAPLALGGTGFPACGSAGASSPDETGGTGFPACDQPELLRTRRNLPHWQMAGSTYFVTFRVAAGALTPAERQLVLEAIQHFHSTRYWVTACVVLPDHVHLLLRPLEQPGGGEDNVLPLGKILQGIKGFTARQLNEGRGTRGRFWQDESYDRIVRDAAELMEKWQYIRHNPVKAELCQEPEAYPFLWEPGLEPEPLGPQAGEPTEPQAGKPVLPNPGMTAKTPPGYLTPVAYLWTRTVRCKNPSCGAVVPLVKQTWLCKKDKRYVAMRLVAPQGKKRVRFEIVEAATEAGLGFDPSLGSKGGNTECPFCRGPVDSDYVKAEGCAGRMGQQMMAIVCTRPGKQGKVYLSADDYPEFVPDDEAIRQRIADLCERTGLTVPDEPMPAQGTLGFRVQPYGVSTWSGLFSPRQMLCLLSFAASVAQAFQPGGQGFLSSDGGEPVGSQTGSQAGKPVLPGPSPTAAAIATCLGLLVNRLADYNSTICHWHNTGEKIGNTFGRQALPMVWDFTELAPFGGASGSPDGALDWITDYIATGATSGSPATVARGSATALPWPAESFDAVITDPPYYDNVPYADISDFFYVWLKRTAGGLFPEHFTTELTPKRDEAIAAVHRHGGSKARARTAYEHMMAQAFAEAHRVLKPGGQMTVVYAHKTTLGWATLVDALRSAGFTVTEAWPLDTEMKARLVAMGTSALASSIFLVARKRDGAATGLYEETVRPELEQIVRERVASLWDMGIVGADLVIAAVGAGLRAFTRFERVEYANGEEVPAERFLAEVEGVVLETLLERIFGSTGFPACGSAGSPACGVGSVDGPTRFYVLWRYTYGAAEMDAGEAIVFTYGQNVELDGPEGLSAGSRALVEKRKAAYRLRDFTERGGNEKLGLPESQGPQAGKPVPPGIGGGSPAPLIDVLHRILWLIENEPRNLNAFLDESGLDRERLRLVAQALGGPGLKGTASLLGSAEAAPSVVTTAREQSALGKLLANWRSLIETRLGFLDNTLFDPAKATPEQGTLSLGEEE